MEPEAYYCEPEDLAKLQRINKTLFSPELLGYDQRRDLANMMDLVLHDIKQKPKPYGKD